MATDPIHQFQIQKLIPIEIGGVDFSFTNSALFMAVTVATASAFLILSTRGRGLVPTRWQSAAEVTYEFIAGTLRQAAELGLSGLPPLVPHYLRPADAELAAARTR